MTEYNSIAQQVYEHVHNMKIGEVVYTSELLRKMPHADSGSVSASLRRCWKQGVLDRGNERIEGTFLYTKVEDRPVSFRKLTAPIKRKEKVVAREIDAAHERLDGAILVFQQAVKNLAIKMATTEELMAELSRRLDKSK